MGFIFGVSHIDLHIATKTNGCVSRQIYTNLLRRSDRESRTLPCWRRHCGRAGDSFLCLIGIVPVPMSLGIVQKVSVTGPWQAEEAVPLVCGKAIEPMCAP